MTPDERLDRLERIMKLIVRAGLRERRDTRDKINALIDSHIKLVDSHSKLADAQTRSESALERLAQAQAHTDKRLDALIDIVKGEHEGQG
jgi:hypothetical protein